MVEAMSPKERQTYTVRCARENDWWIVTVDELDGVFTQARRIDQAWGFARDAIALWLDADPDSFDLALEVDIYGDARDARQEALEARADLEVARARAATASATAVAKLLDAGLPMRDVGVLLEISHQRVAQIHDEAVGKAAPRTVARKAPAKATRARKPAGVKKPAAAGSKVVKSSRSAKSAASTTKASRSGRYVTKSSATKQAARRG